MTPSPADVRDGDWEEQVILFARSEDEGEDLDGEAVDEVEMWDAVVIAGLLSWTTKLLRLANVFYPPGRREWGWVRNRRRGRFRTKKGKRELALDRF